MNCSLARGLLLIFIFGLSVENLFLSFRSKYDGYIYPLWKEKEVKKGHFYEDSVVVGKNFMVLADSLEDKKGLSGVFATHQCLYIADKLRMWPQYSVDQVASVVSRISNHASWMLGFQNIQSEIKNVATNLIYVKLHKNKLFSGMIGNTGFSIFKLDKDKKMMRPINIPLDEFATLKTPFKVTPNTSDLPVKNTHEVEKGDIVMVYSDGVSNVLPPSFLAAATNFLVAKMIEKKKNNKSLDDFDYDYDLADFVESYVQNLTYLSLKLQQSLAYNPNKIKQAPEKVENQLSKKPKDPIPNNHKVSKDLIQNNNNIIDQVSNKIQNIFELEKRFDQKIKVSKPSNQQIQPKSISSNDSEIEDFERENFILSFENDNLLPKEYNFEKSINNAMERIFRFEICNLFDPTENSEIFKMIPESENFMGLTRHNLERENGNTFKDSIDCFRNKKIEKTTTRHKNPTKWNCKEIVHLIYPLPLKKDTENTSLNFHECVNEAIPKLHPSVTPEKIAEAFNSRYFSRNIALAAQYVINDPRLIVDGGILKQFYDQNENKLVFSNEKLKKKSEIWQKKKSDVTIAAAAITSEDQFDKIPIQVDEKTTYKAELLTHSLKLESWLNFEVLPNISNILI